MLYIYIYYIYIYIYIYCCNQIRKPDENITSTLVFTMYNKIILYIYIYMYMCNIYNIIYIHRLRTKRSEKRIKRIRSKRSEMHSDNLL